MGNGTVRVHLRGGLGNQLFQYGAGFALARESKRNLVIDSRLLPVKAESIRGISHWPEQISLFDKDSQFIRGNSGQVEFRVLSRLLQYQRLMHEWGARLGTRFYPQNVFANESGNFSERFLNLQGDQIHINSYCNDRKFFLGRDEEIRERVLSPKVITAQASKAIEISREVRPIGLHVRLGDYKNLPHVYGQFDEGYYLRAISLLQELAGSKRIWLFSDEPKLARNLMPGLPDSVEVPNFLENLSGYETLLVLASTSSLVASSSSFSWWAAFLGEKPGFRAIFPRPTFAVGGPAEPKSALLEDWIQLGRRT